MIVPDQLFLFLLISCRLSTILGSRRIKVSDLCKATGIARATLDRYYYDRVSSFDREVLTKLCDYLEVLPGELIVKVEQGDLFSSPADSDVRIL